MLSRNRLKQFSLVILLIFSSTSVFYTFYRLIRYRRFEVIKDENRLSLLNPTFRKWKVRKVKLPNGAIGVLISDPNTDECGVSIAVRVGSFHDPIAYPGMAHLVEHLILLKPLKGKNKKSFYSILEDNAGRENGFTVATLTVYTFSAKRDALKKLLGPFVTLFLNRSFKKSDIRNELHAVDQEMDKNLQTNYWRSWAPFHEKSPYSFYGGSAKTLKNVGSAEVKKWYDQYYGYGKGFFVVILGKEDLDTLTSMFVKYCSKIPSGNKPPSLSDQGPIFPPELRKKIVYVQPTRDDPELYITWELPGATLIDLQTANVIAYVMNSKGENSLYRQLRKENIANNVHANVYRLGDKLCLGIAISFFKNDQILPIKRAIKRFFQLVKVLQIRGIPEYIFIEKCQIDKIRYTGQDRPNTFSLLEELSRKLPYENLGSFPNKTVIPTYKYEAGRFRNMLNLLRPKSCVFEVLAFSKRSGVVCSMKKEPYNVEYNIVPIPEEKLVEWEEVEEHPNIGLPSKNPFITKEIFSNQPKNTATKVDPVVLKENDHGKVFFYGNSSYAPRKIAWWFEIKSPHINNQPKQVVLMSLYLHSLREALAPVRQLASRAGLYCSFGSTQYTLDVLIDGYRYQASLLLELILNHFSAKKMPTKKQFIQYCNAVSVFYQNQMKASNPLRKAHDMSIDTLYRTPTYTELLRTLSKTTYKDFCEFIRVIFQKAYVKALFSGSLSKKEALDNWGKVMKCFRKPYPEREHLQEELLLLNPSEGPYKVSKNTGMVGHGVRLVVQVGDFTFDKAAAIILFDRFLDVDFFDTLRTKQGTAYQLYSTFCRNIDQLLLSLNILSSTYGPEELLARIEAFLEDYVKQFDQYVSKDRFEKVRKSLIEKLRVKPNTLYAASLRVKLLAFEHDSDFAYFKKVLFSLEKMTYEAFKKYVISFISRKRKQRIAFLVKGRAASQEKDYVYKKVNSDQVSQKGNWVKKKKEKKS